MAQKLVHSRQRYSVNQIFEFDLTSFLIKFALLLAISSTVASCKEDEKYLKFDESKVLKFDHRRGTEELAADALRMLAISEEYQTMGSVFLSRLPQFEEKLVTLYTTSLGEKEPCRWTLAERHSWTRSYQKMKFDFERHLNTTLFGFFRTFDGSPISRGAVTRPATANIETLAMAVHHAGVSDLVLEKFAGFLREKMIRRQSRFPACTWSGRDKREASEGIHALYHKLLIEMSEQVVKMSQFLQTDAVQLKDVSDGYWSQKMYGTLFEGFEQADVVAINEGK